MALPDTSVISVRELLRQQNQQRRDDNKIGGRRGPDARRRYAGRPAKQSHAATATIPDHTHQSPREAAPAPAQAPALTEGPSTMADSTEMSVQRETTQPHNEQNPTLAAAAPPPASHALPSRPLTPLPPLPCSGGSSDDVALASASGGDTFRAWCRPTASHHYHPDTTHSDQQPPPPSPSEHNGGHASEDSLTFLPPTPTRTKPPAAAQAKLPTPLTSDVTRAPHVAKLTVTLPASGDAAATASPVRDQGSRHRRRGTKPGAAASGGGGDAGTSPLPQAPRQSTGSVGGGGAAYITVPSHPLQYQVPAGYTTTPPPSPPPPRTGGAGPQQRRSGHGRKPSNSGSWGGSSWGGSSQRSCRTSQADSAPHALPNQQQHQQHQPVHMSSTSVHGAQPAMPPPPHMAHMAPHDTQQAAPPHTWTVPPLHPDLPPFMNLPPGSHLAYMMVPVTWPVGTCAPPCHMVLPEQLQYPTAGYWPGADMAAQAHGVY